MIYEAKPRCTWRARRIAWCRKFGKFCDAPREYEYCLGYEPIERLHETTPFERVRHNIELLRDQIVPVDRTYRFIIRTLWGDDSYTVAAKDTTEASVKLAKRLQMTEAELAAVLKEVYELKDRRWIKIWEEKTFHQAEIPTEVKESIKRFWQSFLRARGLLVPPFTDVPKAKAELQKALSEIEYQKEHMNPQDYEKIKAHLQWAIDFLEKELVTKAISELEGLFLFLTGKMLEAPTEVFPESLRLKPLFDMQDSLIEHKFPHEKAAIIDTVISLPGDIYREMTHAYPHSTYIGEKWEKLITYCAKPPLSWLQAGDWEEIRNQLQDPSYKALRNQYLSNLQTLREATIKMPMDPKRQAVMTESLDMIKALVLWFESQDPYAPPRQQLDRLTGAVASYFPREFFERPWIQIPAATDMLNIHVKHPSYTSMYNMSVSSTLELKERFGFELRNMILEAEGQKREVGVMLCQTPTGDLHLSRACWGRRGTVTVTDCHDGLNPLGSFHVHLGGTDVFSVPDLELAIKKEQFSCLGYVKAGVHTLKCITPKRYHELPAETKVSIKQSLDQARQDVERATHLYKLSPTDPEAQSLSQRAQATLRNIEQSLDVYEVQL